MARYINADALLNAIAENCQTEYQGDSWYGKEPMYFVDDVIGCIKDAPAADAVSVVRCGQCKFFQSSGCFIGIQGAQISSDNYCAWGQRKHD